MKRPISGTAAILILGVGAVVISLKYQGRISGNEELMGRTVVGPAALARIEDTLDLKPRSTYKAYFVEDRVGNSTVYLARFDLPSLEVPAVFEHVPDFFPPMTDLRDDPEIIRALRDDYVDPKENQRRIDELKRSEWWRPAELRKASCAQRSGKAARTSIRMKTQVAVAPLEGDSGLSSIYIALTMETGK
jgi:hypothetical protein